MSSSPDFEADVRPELPEEFPDGTLTVEREEKVFEESQLSNDNSEFKLQYLLDKGPVVEVRSVQGTDQEGVDRTFTQGTDYVLSDLVRDYEETFVYSSVEDQYRLDREVDVGSVSIEDDSGDTYTNGVDFILVQDDENRDAVLFEEGQDKPDVGESFVVSYEHTFSDSAVEWQTSGDNLPAVGSTFFVRYTAPSILSRYVDGYESEFLDVKEQIDNAVSNKFVDTAEGDSLDQLGELFGPVIGQRQGRSDSEYRTFLKSVVQSFISRGTISGIKLAISAATDVPIEEIEIRENFERNQYEVAVLPRTQVQVSLIENVAEIADPSGVNQLSTRFKLDPDEVQFDDEAIVRTGTTAPQDEEVKIVDTIVLDGGLTEVLEDLGSSDLVEIDDDLTSKDEDTVLDDLLAIDPNLVETPLEEVGSDDDVTGIEKDRQLWEPGTDAVQSNWNFFEWVELLDLSFSSSDAVVSDDVSSIDPNLTTVPIEEVQSDDAFAIDPNLATTSDSTFADDDVTPGVAPDGSASEDMESDDAIAGVVERSVEWETTDWGTLHWAVESTFAVQDFDKQRTRLGGSSIDMLRLQ